MNLKLPQKSKHLSPKRVLNFVKVGNIETHKKTRKEREDHESNMYVTV